MHMLYISSKRKAPSTETTPKTTKRTLRGQYHFVPLCADALSRTEECRVRERHETSYSLYQPARTVWPLISAVALAFVHRLNRMCVCRNVSVGSSALTSLAISTWQNVAGVRFALAPPNISSTITKYIINNISATITKYINPKSASCFRVTTREQKQQCY